MYHLRAAFASIDCAARDIVSIHKDRRCGVPFALPLFLSSSSITTTTTSREDLTRLAFHNVATLSSIWNLVLDKVSCDVEWLLSVWIFFIFFFFNSIQIIISPNTFFRYSMKPQRQTHL